jgi:hypothetical protein
MRFGLCTYIYKKVVELGYSDHFAHVRNIAFKCSLVHSGKTVKRVFSVRNIEIFNTQLKMKYGMMFTYILM